MTEVSRDNTGPAAMARAVWDAVGLPRWVKAALLLCAGFGLLVSLIGWAIGVPLAAPTERVNLALGLNAGVPILLGFVGYALAQGLNMAMTRRFEFARIGRAARTPGSKAEELTGTPVGQIVGQMNQVQSAHQLIYQLVEEYVDATTRLHELSSRD